MKKAELLEAHEKADQVNRLRMAKILCNDLFFFNKYVLAPDEKYVT